MAQRSQINLAGTARHNLVIGHKRSLVSAMKNPAENGARKVVKDGLPHLLMRFRLLLPKHFVKRLRQRVDRARQRLALYVEV